MKRTNHNLVKRDVTEMSECRRQRKTKRLCFELRVGMSLKAEALHTNNILSYWTKVVNVYTLVLFSIIDEILCNLRSVPAFTLDPVGEAILDDPKNDCK